MIDSILKNIASFGLFIILCTPPIVLAFLIIKIKRIKWKFPPTERKAQFIFSFTCLFYTSIIAFPVWFLLKISNSSLFGFWILILILAFSFISLFRPVFSKGILATVFAYSCIIYFEKRPIVTSISYYDICNKLRQSEDCIETKTKFMCKETEQGKLSEVSKSECSNKVGNSDYRFVTLTSSRVGEIFRSIEPSVIIKNLPRNECKTRLCGHWVELRIDDIQNICSNCFRPEMLTTRMRVNLLVPGQKFKLLEEFETIEKNLIGHKMQYILLQDQDGTLYELHKFDFERIFITGYMNRNKENEEYINENLKQIRTSGFTELKIIQRLHEVKSGRGLVKFVQDFKFNDEITYELIHFDNRNIETYKVKVKTTEAFMTLKYLGTGWNISFGPK